MPFLVSRVRSGLRRLAGFELGSGGLGFELGSGSGSAFTGKIIFLIRGRAWFLGLGIRFAFSHSQ